MISRRHLLQNFQHLIGSILLFFMPVSNRGAYASEFNKTMIKFNGINGIPLDSEFDRGCIIMRKKQRKMNMKLLAFLKAFLGIYLRHTYRTSAENADAAALKPPYVLLANHTNFWDPFFLSIYMPEPVCFVTSDAYFRNPILKRLLRMAGAIPKSKFIADAVTVLDILRVKKNGGVIGIFPEGKRNWNGRTGELLFATAKLVKSLKVPVLTATLQGAHLSFPRWAIKSRRGRIVIRYQVSLTPDSIAAMSTQEIHRVLGNSLSYSEYNFQRQNHILFSGRKLAENLELYLFICPECHSLCSLVSKGDTIACRNCDFSARYGKEGVFETDPERNPFETPEEWGDWQEKYFREFLSDKISHQEKSPIFRDCSVTLKQGRKMIPLKKINFGQALFYIDRIEFINLRKQVMSFPLDRISGINVQARNQFEFYYEESLYRFTFRSLKISAYKWTMAVRLVRELCGRPILTD